MLRKHVGAPSISCGWSIPSMITAYDASLTWLSSPLYKSILLRWFPLLILIEHKNINSWICNSQQKATRDLLQRTGVSSPEFSLSCHPGLGLKPKRMHDQRLISLMFEQLATLGISWFLDFGLSKQARSYTVGYIAHGRSKKKSIGICFTAGWYYVWEHHFG